MGKKELVTMVNFMLAIRGEYNRRDLQQIESKLRAACMSMEASPKIGSAWLGDIEVKEVEIIEA